VGAPVGLGGAVNVGDAFCGDGGGHGGVHGRFPLVSLAELIARNW
jgi:hypothetical protein